FCISSHLHHHSLHSFPTRRSSDLRRDALSVADVLNLRRFSCIVVREVEYGLNAVTALARELHAALNLQKSIGNCKNLGPVSPRIDRKSTRLNSSHVKISYAVFCLK